MYLTLKILHASCALLSILGFAGRGYLKASRNHVPTNFAFKVLPHIVDTLLLVSAIALVLISGQYPFVVSWVTAKVIGLIVYIGLGIALMRSHADKGRRWLLYGLALASGIYILTVAISKSAIPLG